MQLAAVRRTASFELAIGQSAAARPIDQRRLVLEFPVL